MLHNAVDGFQCIIQTAGSFICGCSLWNSRLIVFIVIVCHRSASGIAGLALPAIDFIVVSGRRSIATSYGRIVCNAPLLIVSSIVWCLGIILHIGIAASLIAQRPLWNIRITDRALVKRIHRP